MAFDKDRKAWNSTLRPVAKNKSKKDFIKRPSVNQLLSSGKVFRGNSEPTLRELSNILDDWWSQMVRLMDSDDAGRVKCFTCTSEFHWKEMDCGHFMPRTCMPVRWDARNTKPQCERCNRQTDNGNRDIFAKNLDALYGVGTSAQVEIESKQMRKWTRAELIDKIQITKGVVTKLKASK